MEILFVILKRAIIYYGEYLVSERRLSVEQTGRLYLGFDLSKFETWDIATALRFIIADFDHFRS